MPRPALTPEELKNRPPGYRTKAVVPATNDVPAGRPRFPKDLSATARRVFKQLCSLLEDRRHLTAGDIEAIRLYAILYARHVRAKEHLEQEGEVCEYTRLDSNGQPHQVAKANLWLPIAERCEKNMASLLCQLGLTPAARVRVRSTPAPQEPDELERIMNRRRGPAIVPFTPPAPEEK